MPRIKSVAAGESEATVTPARAAAEASFSRHAPRSPTPSAAVIQKKKMRAVELGG